MPIQPNFFAPVTIDKSNQDFTRIVFDGIPVIMSKSYEIITNHDADNIIKHALGHLFTQDEPQMIAMPERHRLSWFAIYALSNHDLKIRSSIIPARSMAVFSNSYDGTLRRGFSIGLHVAGGLIIPDNDFFDFDANLTAIEFQKIISDLVSIVNSTFSMLDALELRLDDLIKIVKTTKIPDRIVGKCLSRLHGRATSLDGISSLLSIINQEMALFSSIHLSRKVWKIALDVVS